MKRDLVLFKSHPLHSLSFCMLPSSVHSRRLPLLTGSKSIIPAMTSSTVPSSSFHRVFQFQIPIE